MQLQISPNSWSCLPTSFAMACNVSLKEMLDLIGHDGSEIIWPEMKEPFKRRAFHIQECILATLSLGLSCTQIDFRPQSTPNGVLVYEMDHSDFANHFMSKHCGVLTGKGRKTFHAVGWDTKKVYDPAGREYSLPNSMFTPHTIWLI